MDNKALVKSLIERKLLKNKKTIAAFKKVDRKDFVPAQHEESAYSDAPIPILGGQTISAPHMVAVMTEALDVIDGQKISEVGAGSGYQAAILAILDPRGKIFTIEWVSETAAFAIQNLKSFKNIKFRF